MRARRGFTLIELLVVIAIIAILAAILFPVFAKAREKARETSCLSNVKQLMLACLQYATDYNEGLPSAWQWNPNPWESAGWCTPAYPDWCDWGSIFFTPIQPYIRNASILECPSDPGGGKWRDWARPPLSYCYNEYVYDTGRGWFKLASTANNAPAGVASVTLITECFSTGIYNDWDNGCGGSDGMDRVRFGNQNPCRVRHSAGQNCGFIDGHAKLVKTDMIRHDDGANRQWPVVNPAHDVF